MRRLARVSALLALAALAPASARAISGHFDASVGFSSIEIVAGRGFNQVMESLSTIEVRYHVSFESVNSTFGLGFQELFDTNFGNLSYTRLDLGGRWYPFGLNGQRKVLDNEVEGKFWNSRPFVGISMGISNTSIDAGKLAEFNAVMFDLGLRLGLEVPAGTDFIVIGQLGYLFSLSSFAESTELTAIDYGGYQMMLGIRVTPF